MHFVLTVYRDDDATPLFEVGTSAAHPHPYLHVPGEMDLGEVDLLAGKAMIGQVNLRVIDPQTGPTQAERWMTARLGIPQGQEGAGHSALNGRRAALRRADGRLVMDGVIWGVQLSDTAAGFHLQLRDIRERTRKLHLFARTGTATVLPRGVLGGYGKLPNGGWLVPPTTPLAAVFRTPGAWFDLRAGWSSGDPLRGKAGDVRPDLVITDQMRQAARIVLEEGEPYDYEYAPGEFVEVTPRVLHHPDITLLWRATGSSEWREIRAPMGGAMHGGAFFLTSPGRLRATGTAAARDVPAAAFGLGINPSTPGLPANGTVVEVMVRYDGPPTKAFPLHFEGTAGELLRNIYRGDYARLDEEGEPVATGIRYDEVALLKLTAPARLRITEPPKDSREWIEKIYKAIGAAPALDAEGRISPVVAALPPASSPLPEINDANAVAIPGWDHPADRAITAVSVKYPRDYRVPARDDPLGERSAGDGIDTVEVTVEHAAPPWVVGLMGEQVHEIDASIFRSLGGIDGSAASGDVLDETGAQAAKARTRETLDRWLFGGQTSFCRVRAADFPGLREGDWVIDARSWRPNYRLGLRGGQTLAQVVSVRAVNPVWLDLRLVDAGPADQPLNPPVLGTLGIISTDSVLVPITSVPAGAEAAVHYAIATAQPAADSALWTFAGRVRQGDGVEVPPAPAGSRVWVRARSEAEGRRPSSWTAAKSIVVSATPRIRGVAAEIGEDGAARVFWEPNPYAKGVRIYYAIHDAGTEPPPFASLDRSAADREVALPDPVGALQVITVEVEPWTGWTGSAVSGTKGAQVPISVAANRPPPVEIPPIPDYAECHARIAWAESDREHYVVQVTSVPASGQVYLYSLQGATIVSGPGLGVPAASGTKWKLRRPAERSADGEAVWRADPPGYVPDDDAVIIAAIGRDTVPLTGRVRQISKTATTRTVRASVGDPHYGESSDPVTITYANQGTGGITPASGRTIPAAAIRATPDATEGQTGGYVDFVITRPAAGSGDGRAVFTFTRPGRVQDVDPVDVTELPPTIPAQSLEPRINTTFVRHVGDQWWELITATDWQGGVAGLEFRYVYYRDGTAHPGWPGFLPLGAGGAEVQVGLDGRWPTHLDVQAKDAAGRIANKSVLLPAHDLTTFTDVEYEVATGMDEAIDTAAGYTDQQAGAAEQNSKLYADQQASTAKSEAISSAALDATSKASTAQSNAITAAAADATTKSGQARTGAYDDAITTVEGRGLYDDGYDGYVYRGSERISTSVLEDQSGAQDKADWAEAGAINEAHDRGLTPQGFTGVLGGAGGLDAEVVAQQVREPSANLLPPHAGRSREFAGVVLQMYYLPDLEIDLTALGFLAAARLSFSARVHISGANGNVQVGLLWIGAGGVWLDYTMSAEYFATTNPITISVPAAQIPAGALRAQPVVRRMSSAGGTAPVYVESWMLNRGAVSLTFDHPGWRPGRPGEEALPVGTKIYDVASVPREVARGIRQGEVGNDSFIILDPSYQDTPAFIASPGGISYHAELSGASHGQVIRFLDPSPTGAKMYAWVRAVVSAPTRTPIAFGNGGFGDPQYIATKAASDQAYDFRYYYNFQVVVLPGGVVKVGFHYRTGGGAWVLAGVRSYESGQIATVYVDLADMGAGSQFGIQIEDMTGPGGNLTPNEAYWYVAAKPAEREATTPGLLIPYTVIGGT